MWKKSEVWNNKKFRALVILELILVIIGCIGLIPGNRVTATLDTMQVSLLGGEYDAENDLYRISGETGFQGDFLQVSTGRITPGVYRLEVLLETEENLRNSFRIESKTGRYHELLSNEIAVFANKELQTCQFYVTNFCEDAAVTVYYGGQSDFAVKAITMVKTNAGARIFLTVTIFLSALVNTLVMLYCYMGKYPVEREKKLVWFGIPVIAVIASFPILTDYMAPGVDHSFHIMRIEALAQSICQGNIPARIESVWLCGHGYANSIFYCDTFLLFPAILRILGFDMIVAYNSYVFAVNLATALIAYVSFQGIFKNRYAGMLGSLLYTLAPYHIYNIFNRSAVGEYTAMTFLPLLVYGFYLIFTEDTEEREYRHYWLIPTLGFTGIIQSHVLSCEIVGAFTVLLCLIMIKKVFRKRTFLELIKVVAGTVLLNAWFLVPFLDMTLAGDYYFSNNANVTVQERGIQLANIFNTMQAAGENSRFHELGLLDTEPFGVGMAILLGMAAWILTKNTVLRKTEECADSKASCEKVKSDTDSKLNGAVVTALVIGAVATFMSTSYFPWDAIQSLNSITGTLVPMLQFTTRLTIIPTVCFSFVACAGAYRVLKCGSRFLKGSFLLLVCGSSVLFSLYQTNDFLLIREGALRLYSMENIGNAAVLGAEYLPLGSKMPFSYHEAVPSGGVTVSGFTKKNLDIRTQLVVEDGENEYYVELPLLFYKGYQAEDTETGEHFGVVPGTNHEVRVMLPAGYSGTLRTWYTGMWYWHVAEVVSLMTAGAILAGVLAGRRKKKFRS